MVHLNEVWAKFKDKGLVILSVTNEGRQLVDGFVAKNSPTYPIVIESGDSGTKFGITGYPSAFLIGADGKIAWSGNFFDEGAQGSLLDTLFAKQRIAPKLPDKFAPVAKLLEKNKFADARKLLETLAGGRVTEEEKKVLDDTTKWIDDGGTAALASAADDEKAGEFGDAATAYEQLIANYAGLDPAAKADAALKALKADPAKKKEIDATKALAAAQDKATGLPPKKAIPFFKSVVSNYKDTKAGQKAVKILADLEAEEARAKK